MIFLVFIIGLIVGSFLNVVIYRLNSGHHLGGRSSCPNCKYQLKWHDLLPILSFVFLKGRCRYCHKKISWQYPTVEILSGFVWLGVFYKNLYSFQFLNFSYEIIIFSVFLVIAVYDYRWKIIPDKIIYPAIITIFLYNVFVSFKYSDFGVFIYPLFVAIIAFLFFFAIYFFSKGNAMGLGDAKLAFLIGLFLNPLSAVLAFASIFIIGAAFGIILICLGRIFSGYKKWKLKSHIAFGPFMVLGAAIAFFLFNNINNLLIF